MFSTTASQIAIISLSILIIILVLIQDRSSGSGSIFGSEGGVYQKRRGLERIFFGLTAISIVAFLTLLIINLVLQA